MKIRADMCACFIVRPSAGRFEFLQIQRSPGRYMAGSWQTVMGGIEPGETAIAAALRELGEETGLTPIEFYQLDEPNTFFIAAQDTIFHCAQFCAVVAADCVVRLNEEHDALRWVWADDAESHFIWPGDQRAIREILSQILKNGPAKSHMRILPAQDQKV